MSRSASRWISPTTPEDPSIRQPSPNERTRSWRRLQCCSRNFATSQRPRSGGTRRCTGSKKRGVLKNSSGRMSRPTRATPQVRTAVIGAGSWGTTFAKILADSGADVTIWARRPEVARELDRAKRNSGYLPGISLPATLRATSRLSEALAGAQQVYLSLPSQALRDNLAALAPYLTPDVTVISLMKGVEKTSGLRMSELIVQNLPVPQE